MHLYANSRYLCYNLHMKSVNLALFTKQLLQKGRYSFEKKEALQALGCSNHSFINASIRLAKKNELALVKTGFYIIVPPQHYALGCLPAEWFIDDLMKYLEQPYYIGLLSAASYYGATHQQPQRLQVITNKQTRPVAIGKVSIEFIVNKHISNLGTNQRNSYTGQITISSPELTMVDVCTYPKHTGHIHNMAQVISDLGDAVDSASLDMLLQNIPIKTTVLQRLGFLLDLTNNTATGNVVYKYYSTKGGVNYIWLAPSENLETIEQNKRWKININEQVELDI